MLMGRQSLESSMLFLRLFHRYRFLALILALLLLGALESARQLDDTRYVTAVARAVIQKTGASTPRARVIALRYYVRPNVSFAGAPYGHRPFLRATDGDTLRSGPGYCGEASRTFISMAPAV